MEAQASTVAIEQMPLRLQFPKRFASDPLFGIMLEENVTVSHVCDELRKVYMRCCGMPHENWSSNESRQPCKGIEEEYNVVCVHSKADGAYWQAWLTSRLIGKDIAGGRLFLESRRLLTELDDIDGNCRPLYQLSMDGTTSMHSDPTRNFLALAQLGIPTAAHPGEGEKVRKCLAAEQAKRGKRLLEIRDKYLDLLKP
ncbi:hypothetical protein COU78_00205 [Candidatus Peregrinibacteria bacterium CG10_big_fil_rev_8_21_14_0_10_49_24]|nr:MAG: hypothetical protein COV83_06250 [Candidatus Peregrinibacteria bacterium CG11_big_fil_rev_8_21_14_0_20_49_14]PIR51611.1 MAG: hypothetical protein COU78_00205 [Candidatus Peregrinibacteria bacterium CG10_big_fil_rev_8_21_14_0_10_49_24]PJA68028.1 MAG: hypothetical protein CO157_01755 [Candidatus Peregrinibacteria bacterium CG_4_9_14_3_um_filter_49_12]